MPSLKSTFKHEELCAICGEGRSTSCELEKEIEYKGTLGKVSIQISKCSSCGSETANDDQSIFNRRSIIRFKKRIDRIPQGSQIRVMRKACGITQAEAGKLFGGGPVAFSKYENDDLIPDEAMANLLRLAIHDISIVETLRQIKELNLVSTIRLTTVASFKNEVQEKPTGRAIFKDTQVIDLDTSEEFSSVFSSYTPSVGSPQSWKTLN